MISVLCKWEIYASKITKKELCSQFIWNGTLGTPLVIIIRWLHKIGFLLIKYHASIELYAVVLAVLNRLSVQHKVRETSNVGCTWSIWNEACGVKSLVSSCRIWPCTLQMLEGRYCLLIHVRHSFNSITAMSTTGERKARLDPVYSRCWKHATARWSLNIIYFIYHLWKLCHILVARVHTSWKKHWIVYGYWKLKYNMESHFCVRAMQRYTTICGEDIIIKKSQIKVFFTANNDNSWNFPWEFSLALIWDMSLFKVTTLEAVYHFPKTGKHLFRWCSPLCIRNSCLSVVLLASFLGSYFIEVFIWRKRIKVSKTQNFFSYLSSLPMICTNQFRLSYVSCTLVTGQRVMT